ncbi:MAG: hypothetical protein H8E55_61625 [Pelagibacterales bacterium]|nr:hypothetical protein [Pelagibacterales bacterium]
MKIFFQKILKFNFFAILIFFSFSCGAGGNGVNILYMFDTSGSFYKNALPSCLSLATEIFSELKNDNSGLGIYPQFHQVVTIDEQSVDIGKNCGVKVEQSNIFKKETLNQNQTLNKCLDLVKGDNYSIYTDLVGALLNASKSFESGGFYGKGLIIFSDLHEDVPDIKKYDFDLSGVSVFIIHEFSNEQLRNPSIFENDKKRIKNLLLKSGCKENDILFRNLSSVITSPNEVVSFFRKTFRDNR